MKYIFITLLTAWSWTAWSQQSFTLSQAMDYALSNHSQMKLNDLDARNAEATVKEFRSIGMPKVDAGIDYSYYLAVPRQPVEDFLTPSIYGVLFAEGVIPQRDLGPAAISELSFVQPNSLVGKVGANMLIFDGSYLYGLKAARLYRDLVKVQRGQSEQNVKANVARAYMSIVVAQRNREVIAQNIAVVEKSLADTREIFASGFAESLDVERLELSLESLQNQIATIDKMIDLANNALKFQMSYPVDQELTVTDNLETLVASIEKDNIDLRSDIDMSRRAEFAVLDKNQELNVLDMKRHKAGYLPSARGFVNIQESLQRKNLFDNDEAGWLPTAVAGIGINIPIYDGGEKSAKIEQVKINMERNDIQKNELARAITLQVRNAQLSMQSALDAIAIGQKNIDLSQKIYDKAKIKFNEGVGSSIEVSQAESALYQAQANYISALYDLLSAKTDLDIALGQL